MEKTALETNSQGGRFSFSYANGLSLEETEKEASFRRTHSTLGVKKASKIRIGEAGKAWIALIPALIFLLFFMIYPILNTFIMSFMENFTFVKGSGGSFAIANFIAALNNPRVTNPSLGFGNYVRVLSDEQFLFSLRNTVLIVVVSVPLTIIVGLLIAVCLHSIKPLQGFFQTVFFLPYVTNAIALGMVFKIIFTDGDAGLFNAFLHLFGIEAQQWLSVGAPAWNNFFVIIIYSIWNGIAFKILVFMSGLSSIDKQYYDAAKIDGASRATIFRRITVPLLSPQILYITITSFIGAFKSYTQIISLFGGGAYDFGGTKKDNWITVVGYIYRIMQDSTKNGRAAAASFVLLIIILLITLVQMAVSKKKVVY
ncbi:MAG: sugar ABC transporter permease [Bacilli bacterium]|nr:sugar ABC transporter permease [Bacilli bacterium]